VFDEADIAELPPIAAVFLESYGLKEPGLARLVARTYALMGLISFFTVGEDEVRPGPSLVTLHGRCGGNDPQRLGEALHPCEVVGCDDLDPSGKAWPRAARMDYCAWKEKKPRFATGTSSTSRHSG